MGQFTDPLVVIQITGKEWKTAREFRFHVGDKNSEDLIVVPKGFITDFASVPWPASMFIPKSGRYNQAAVLHDFLYTKQTRSRKECDDIFLEAMEVLGVQKFKRWIMYKAVRLFGHIPWNAKKPLYKKSSKKS